jgi:CRISPR-associated protein Cmr1
MARTVPPGIEPPAGTPQRRGVETLRLEIEVITPMFGGGHTPREVDEACPVRAASIRGHLRFWWRATAGARYSTPEKLFEAESALWGAAATFQESGSGPGSVSLHVEVTAQGAPVKYSQLAGDRRGPRRGPGLGYLLFPFKDEKGGDGQPGAPEAVGRRGVHFRLRLCYPQQNAAEVQDALLAWLTLGGVGARTRRGCGALWSGWEAYPRDAAAFERWVGGFPAPEAPVPHPVLAGCRYAPAETPEGSAEQAWTSLAKFWARFRKGHFDERGYEPMRGGRWRDYRTLTELRGDRAAEAVRLNKPSLGLPIIYQRLRGTTFAGTLEPGDSGRMASPVILRPVRFGSGYHPLVVVLRAPAPAAIRVQGRGTLGLNEQPDDPVLRDLRATDPRSAVLAAWERHVSDPGVQRRGPGR